MAPSPSIHQSPPHSREASRILRQAKGQKQVALMGVLNGNDVPQSLEEGVQP